MTNEKKLQRILADGAGVEITDSDLNAISMSRQALTAAPPLEALKSDIIANKMGKWSWYHAFPQDGYMYDGTRDMTDRQRAGEYVRYMLTIQKWGLQHEDEQISSHFSKRKCPCTGKDPLSSWAFLTKNIAEKFLNENTVGGSKAHGPTAKGYLNAINSQISIQKIMCDFLLGHGKVQNELLRRRGVGDSGIEGIEQETEMPIREQKGAQNAHEKHIVQAHNLSQWRMSYADALRGVSSDKAEDERVPTASVSTGRCKRVSWKLDPAVKE